VRRHPDPPPTVGPPWDGDRMSTEPREEWYRRDNALQGA
jgi:hypothetical protein